MLSNITRLPEQRVSRATRMTKEWYIDTADYYIAKAIASNDRGTTRMLYETAKGNINPEHYSKTLNPFNATNEKLLRHPAEMRNLDMIKPITRRMVGEYIRQEHEMMILSVNPDVVYSRNRKVEEQVINLAVQMFINVLNENGTETGEPTAEIPDVNEFVENFKQEYISEESERAQDLLTAVEVYTNAEKLYAMAYYDWIVAGEVFTYRDIKKGKFIKKRIDPNDAFPIFNGEPLVEDMEGFLHVSEITMTQLLDEDEELTEEDFNYIKEVLRNNTQTHAVNVPWEVVVGYHGSARVEDYCKRNGTSGNYTRQESFPLNKRNGDTITKHHIVYRTEVKEGILKFTNELGFEDEMIVDEDFELPANTPGLEIEWRWVSKVFEQTRYGVEPCGIYTKPKPVIYQRDGKLPYNGLVELLPNFGRFSIPEILLPFQLSRNIFNFYRETAIAKFKTVLTFIPESILGTTGEQVDRNLHRLITSGVHFYDDSEDGAVNKINNGIKQLDANIGDYVQQTSEVMELLKQEAWEAVDMTPQRYGQIGNNAGKGVTEEAIIRGSMGSVVVVYMFDKFREADYNADIAYTKLAWMEGRTEALLDKDGKTRYIELDANYLSDNEFMIVARNSDKYNEQLAQLKEFAFAAAQNGDTAKAFTSVTSSSIDKIQRAWDRFDEIQRQHEETLKQLDIQEQEAKAAAEQQKADLEHQHKMEQIEAKGEIDKEVARIRVNAGIDQYGNDTSLYGGKNNLSAQLSKEQSEDRKFAFDKEKEDRRQLEADRNYRLAQQKQTSQNNKSNS